jgi:hyperosmotically inducible protein
VYFAKKFIILLGCGIILASFWACRTPAGRTAGEVIDDSTITTKVKTKLFQDQVLSGFAISVTTFEGEVTLTGSVDTPLEKKRASNLARKVYGVNGVNNLLKLK